MWQELSSCDRAGRRSERRSEGRLGRPLAIVSLVGLLAAGAVAVTACTPQDPGTYPVRVTPSATVTPKTPAPSTPAPTVTVTATPTVTVTATPTVTVTATPTVTSAPTAIPTVTAAPAPTVTVTVTAAPAVTPTVTTVQAASRMAAGASDAGYRQHHSSRRSPDNPLRSIQLPPRSLNLARG